MPFSETKTGQCSQATSRASPPWRPRGVSGVASQFSSFILPWAVLVPRALPLHLCTSPQLRVCHREPSRKPRGGQRRPAESVSIPSTLPSDPGGLRRQSPHDRERHFPSSLKKSQNEDPPRLPASVSTFSLRDQGPELNSWIPAPQPTFWALPALSTPTPARVCSQGAHLGQAPGDAPPSPLSTLPGPVPSPPPHCPALLEGRVLPAFGGGLPSSRLQTASFPRGVFGSPSRPSGPGPSWKGLGCPLCPLSYAAVCVSPSQTPTPSRCLHPSLNSLQADLSAQPSNSTAHSKATITFSRTHSSLLSPHSQRPF